MTWFDKLLHILGAASAGLIATAAATNTSLPKGVIIAAGITSYVGGAAAKSLMKP